MCHAYARGTNISGKKSVKFPVQKILQARCDLFQRFYSQFILATKYYEKLNVGVVNCQNDEMKQICNLYNGNFQFFEKTILTQAGGQSTEIDFESIEESIANLLLPELPIWDGSVFWKHVHSTPTLVFFEFSNEFSSNLDLRFITPLVENDEFDVVIVSCTSSQKNFR